MPGWRDKLMDIRQKMLTTGDLCAQTRRTSEVNYPLMQKSSKTIMGTAVCHASPRSVNTSRQPRSLGSDSKMAATSRNLPKRRERQGQDLSRAVIEQKMTLLVSLFVTQ